MHFNAKASTYEAHATPQRRFAEALAAFAPLNWASASQSWVRVQVS